MLVERSYRTTAYHLAYYAHLHLFRTNKTNDQYILLFLLLNFMQIRIYSVHFASQHLIISLQYIFSFLYNNKSILLPHYVMIKLYFELCVFIFVQPNRKIVPNSHLLPLTQYLLRVVMLFPMFIQAIPLGGCIIAQIACKRFDTDMRCLLVTHQTRLMRCREFALGACIRSYRRMFGAHMTPKPATIVASIVAQLAGKWFFAGVDFVVALER